jgi:hypothetical protein
MMEYGARLAIVPAILPTLATSQLFARLLEKKVKESDKAKPATMETATGKPKTFQQITILIKLFLRCTTHLLLPLKKDGGQILS